MPYARLNGGAAILYDDEFVLADGEIIRKNMIALGDDLFRIGGSRSKGIEGASRQDVDDYINFPIDGVEQAGFSYYVYVDVMTADAGTTVQPILRDVTAGSDLWTGTASASGTWVEQVSSALTLPAAERRYRLQVIKSNANALVYAIGFLRRRG